MSLKVNQSHGTILGGPQSKYSRKVFFEYSPGESSFQLGYLGSNESTVEGILRLRYNDDKPIFAKKIIISFVGKEFVHFAGTLEEGQEPDNESEIWDEEVSNTTISTHTAKRRLFSASIKIWKSQSKGQYESIKYLDLPFKFNLPNNLPPSVVMDGGCGRIYYMLKAVISRQQIDPISLSKKKVIKYIVPIVRYTITPQPEAINWIRNQEEGQAKNHVLDHNVSVTRSVFSPGESVVIPVKLSFHEPQVYLKNIFVGLKEYHELRTDKVETLTKKYLAEETVQANTIQGPDNEYSIEVKFNIPFERGLVYSVDTTYLTVYHKLKVKICLGKAPDLRLSNFVKVEKIVSKDEVFPSPPPKIETSETRRVSQEVVTAYEPVVVKPKHQSYRRLSPFFPLFNRIQNNNLPLKKIPLRFQSIQLHITDSKNPNLIYNSRSLIVSHSQAKQVHRNKIQQVN